MIIRFLISVIMIGISTGLSFAQIDISQINLAGIIYADDTVKAPPYVHVVNKRTGKGVISDSLGLFKIKINRNDTLIDFKLYLDYSRIYLLNTNQYDIFENVKEQIPEFKKTYFK